MADKPSFSFTAQSSIDIDGFFFLFVVGAFSLVPQLDVVLKDEGGLSFLAPRAR